MSINAIAIDRLFSKEGLDPSIKALRVAVLMTLASSALVPIPATSIETSGGVREYYLSNMEPFIKVLDGVREAYLFDTDRVLSNAFQVWVMRYNMVHQFIAGSVIYAGNNYNDALKGIANQSLSELKVTESAVGDVIEFMKKAAGIDTKLEG